VTVRRVLDLRLEELLPTPSGLLASRGLPAEDRFLDLAERARSEIRALGEPRGVREELAREEFVEVYRGEGDNDPHTPLDQVVPRADRLALFAVTLGNAVSEAVTTRFSDRDLALGWMLDAAASLAADTAADVMAADFAAACRHGNEKPVVLPYSPGYCGWAVSGQRRLFARLQPVEVGITLNASCVMQPLKSVSGVLVAGPVEAHLFDNEFDCCASCTTRECEARVAQLGGTR
jgi:hypothetical protein